MNYSIIFTEIIFSTETSILLQIIQIIHITLWIMPEFDREGRTVCQFWLQDGKPQRDSHRKNRVLYGSGVSLNHWITCNRNAE